MQAKLFGYTVERSVGGAVFEVVDSAGEPRLLLEWTPPADEREAARLRLESAAAELQAEVFTADASLYLVVRDRREAAEALRVLQRRELFSGNWLEAPVPVAVAAPPVLPPSAPLAAPFRNVAQGPATPPPAPRYSPAPVFTPAAAPTKKASTGKGCVLAFLGFVLFVATWSVSDRFVIAAAVLVVYSILLPRLLKLWSGV